MKLRVRHPHLLGLGIMRPLRLKKVWLALGWFAVCVLIYESLTPSPPELPAFPFSDKVTHFLVYAWIMLWFGFIYSPGKKYLLLGLSLILLGVTLEGLQGAGGYRSMEVSDASLNALGVFVGGLLARTRLSSALLWAERLIYTSIEPRA
jgi:VanZ family protein